MTWIWVAIGALAIWGAGLTIALFAFLDEHREWVRESSRRILHVTSAFEMHQVDNRKDMRKLRKGLKKAQLGMEQTQKFYTALESAVNEALVREQQPSLDPENTEYLYRVIIGTIVGVTCPPNDPDLRTILWENSQDLIDQVSESDPSLIDSFEFIEAREL